MKKRQSGYKSIQQKDWDNIKFLISKGFTDSEVHRITNRSTATIYYVKKSNSLENYKHIVAEQKKPKLKPVEVPKPLQPHELLFDGEPLDAVVKPSEVHWLTEAEKISIESVKVEQSLAKVAKQLERIADLLESKTTKKYKHWLG